MFVLTITIFFLKKKVESRWYRERKALTYPFWNRAGWVLRFTTTSDILSLRTKKNKNLEESWYMGVDYVPLSDLWEIKLCANKWSHKRMLVKMWAIFKMTWKTPAPIDNWLLASCADNMHSLDTSGEEVRCKMFSQSENYLGEEDMDYVSHSIYSHSCTPVMPYSLFHTPRMLRILSKCITAMRKR